MPVKHAHSSLALFLTIVACGPQDAGNVDALFGTYSEIPAGISNQNTSISRNYVIQEDGTFLIQGYKNCGADELQPEEYQWVRHGDDAIEVLFPDADEGAIESWRITRGADCNQIVVEWYQGGKPVKKLAVTRGEVCVEPTPPCPGSTCESCRTVWCDEPPPACVAASS